MLNSPDRGGNRATKELNAFSEVPEQAERTVTKSNVCSARSQAWVDGRGIFKNPVFPASLPLEFKWY